MVEPLTASFSEALTQFDLTDSLDLDVVGLIPESVARENRLLVLANARNGLIIAAAEEVDEDVLEKLQFILNRRIQILQVSRDWIEHKIDEYYS